MTSVNVRASDHPIDAMFLQRWSPRAFMEDAISERDLLTILEAARWAPSSFNAQPWRFLYARRGTSHWENVVCACLSCNVRKGNRTPHEASMRLIAPPRTAGLNTRFARR